jgi:hypothetical protein
VTAFVENVEMLIHVRFSCIRHAVSTTRTIAQMFLLVVGARITEAIFGILVA